jgi:phage gpG-like protein
MRLSVDVLNDDHVRENLKDLGDRAVNAKPVLERAARVMANGIIVNFGTHGAYLGRPWVAKADGTPATLVRDGGLAADVGNLQRATRTMAVAGIKGPSAFIARFHQGGTKDRKGGTGRQLMPARPIVGIADHDRVTLLDMLERHLMDGSG